MKRYMIFCKDDTRSNNVKEYLIERLSSFMLYDHQNPDIVISVGGDGTMLQAIHQWIDQDQFLLFVGIHTGTLGFLTSFLVEEVDHLIEMLLEDQISLESHSLLEVNFDHDPKTYYAINEMRLENNFVTCVIDVYLNQTHLERFRGNGLNVSTPLGSTAYNKSLGGAVIDSHIEAMQLTEVAGIQNNAFRSLQSPIVLGKDYVLKLKVDQVDEHMIFGVDQMVNHFNNGQEVHIKISDKKLHLIVGKKHQLALKLERTFIKDET